MDTETTPTSPTPTSPTPTEALGVITLTDADRREAEALGVAPVFHCGDVGNSPETAIPAEWLRAQADTAAATDDAAEEATP